MNDPKELAAREKWKKVAQGIVRFARRRNYHEESQDESMTEQFADAIAAALQAERDRADKADKFREALSAKFREKLCPECGCPMLKKGQKRKHPDDYRHAQGCPKERTGKAKQ